MGAAEHERGGYDRVPVREWAIRFLWGRKKCVYEGGTGKLWAA